MVLVAPGLAVLRQATNEGPGAAVLPTVHYKRATRLCMLPAEMLFTQSLQAAANGQSEAELGPRARRGSRRELVWQGPARGPPAGAGMQRVGSRWLEAT